MSRIVVFAVIVLASASLVGCGPTLGKVTGQVTLDGKPLPNVAVTFMPTGEGGASSGVTDANGNYELAHAEGKGAPPGKYKVGVTTMQKAKEPAVDMSKVTSDSPDYAKMLAQSQSEYNVVVKEPIPAKYNAQTTLEFDVKSGSQVIDLKLESTPSPAGTP